jgi:hypothetical protein
VIDHDVGARAGGRQMRQDLSQLTEPKLGRSTTAAGVLR